MRKVAVVVALLVAFTMTGSVAFALPTDAVADAGDEIEISLVGTVSSPPGASSFGVTVGSGATAMTFIVNVSASTDFKPDGTTLATLVVGDVVAVEGTLTAPLTISATEVELRDDEDEEDEDEDEEEVEFSCEDASNHGECVSAAAHLAKKLLPPGQRGKFVSCVARGEENCDRMLNPDDDENVTDDEEAVEDDQDVEDEDSSMSTADDNGPGKGKGKSNKLKTSKAKKTKVKSNGGRGPDR